MANPVKISDLLDLKDQSTLKEVERYMEKVGEAMEKGLDNSINSIDVFDEAIKRNRKGLEELQKESEKLNTSSKANTEQLEKQAIASVKYQAEIEKLTKEKEKARKQSEKYREDLKKLKKAKDDNNDSDKESANSIKALRKELKESKEAYESLENGINDTSEATLKVRQRYLDAKTTLTAYNKSIRDSSLLNREAEKSTEELVKELKSQNVTYARTQTIITTLNKRLRSLPLDALEKDFHDIADASKMANKRLEEFDDKLGQQPRKIGRYDDALKGLGDSLTMGLATGGVATAVAVGTELVVEGFTAVKDIVVETEKELNLTNKTLDVTGEKLAKVTAEVNATAKTFGTEYKETLDAVNAQSQAFNISIEESNDALNELMILSSTPPDELLEQVKEYSTQFGDAKLSVEQFNNVLITSSKLSAFNDKAPDTIKEFALRMSASSKATKEALGQLGKFGDEADELFKKGDTDEAFKKVALGLEQLESQGKNTKDIIANIFGGAGEDLGTANLIKIGENIDNVNDKLTDYQKSQIALLEANQELSKSEVELTEALAGSSNFFEIIGVNIQRYAIDLIILLVDEVNGLINIWSNLIDFIDREFAPVFNFLGDSFTTVKDALVGFFNTTVGGNKFLKPVIDGLKMMWNFNKELILTIGSVLHNLNKIPERVAGTVLVMKKLWSVIGEGFDAVIKGDLKGLKKIGGDIADEYQKGVDEIRRKRKKVEQEQESKKKEKKESEVISTTPTSSAKVKKVLTEVEKVENEFRERKLKLEIDFMKRGIKDKKHMDKAFAQLEIERNQKVLEATKGTNLEKLKAEKDLLASKQKLEDLNSPIIKKKEELEEIKLTGFEEIEFTRFKIEKQIAINEKLYLEGTRSKEEFEAKNKELDKALIQNDIDRINKQIELRKEAGEVYLDLEVEIIEKQNELLEQAEKEQEKQNIYKVLNDSASEFLSTVNEIEGLVGNNKNKKLFTFLKLAGTAVKGVSGIALSTQNKGFHDGGYTGHGNEWDEAGVVHRGEQVITAKETKELGMNSHNFNFGKAVKDGYFNQFSEVDYTQIGVIETSKPSMIDYSEIGKQVAKNVPRTEIKPLSDGLHILEKELGKVKELVYKKNNRFR